MKKALLLSLLLSSISIASDRHHRISEFTTGSYLGEGHYVTSSGVKGSYSVTTKLSPKAWQLSYLRYNRLENFDVAVEFHDNGFFSATATTNAGDKNVSYTGYGYCGHAQCHLELDLGEQRLEETITFVPSENKIYRLGSMTYDDPYGHKQSLTWEERLLRLPEED